jgi:hypothetical protein
MRLLIFIKNKIKLVRLFTTRKNKTSEVLLIVLGLFLITALVMFYYLEIALGQNLTGVFFSQESLGQFGDYFGGIINPIIGCLSAYFLYKNLQESRQLNSSTFKQIYTEHVSVNLAKKTESIQELSQDIIKESHLVMKIIYGGVIHEDEKEMPEKGRISLYNFAERCVIGLEHLVYCHNLGIKHSTGITSKIDAAEFLEEKMNEFFQSNILFKNLTLKVNSCCKTLNKYIETAGDDYKFLAEEFIFELFDCLKFKKELSREEQKHRFIFYFLLKESEELITLMKKCQVHDFDFSDFLEKGNLSS